MYRKGILDVSHSMLPSVSIASSWKERFPNVNFFKKNLAQSDNRVANFATLAVQVTKEIRGKKSASNTRQCNIISIFSWKPSI